MIPITTPLLQTGGTPAAGVPAYARQVPAAGDGFEVYTVPRLLTPPLVKYAGGYALTRVEDLILGNQSLSSWYWDHHYYYEGSFSGETYHWCCATEGLRSLGPGEYANCSFGNGAINAQTQMWAIGGGARTTFNGGAIYGSIYLYNHQTWVLDYDIYVHGSVATNGKDTGPLVIIVGTAGFMPFAGTANGLKLGGWVQVRMCTRSDSTHAMWGVAAGTNISGLVLWPGASLLYDANAPAIGPTGSGQDMEIGARKVCEPFDAATHAWFAAINTSYANLVAAVASGGFGEHLHDPITGVTVQKSLQ